MAKKDLLKQAAGAHVRKTLGGETPQSESVFSPSSSESKNFFLKESSKDHLIRSEESKSVSSKEFVSSEKTNPQDEYDSSVSTLGDVSSQIHSDKNESSAQTESNSSLKTDKPENSPISNSSSSEAREEKHLPKKNHLHRISSVMRLEDYTKPESPEREGSSRFLKIAGVILLALAIWFFWPAKHEIYMDIDKMTPEKVSGMSSQKEYHFSHGQDFFVYYKKGWSTPKKVRLTIYRTDGGKEEFSVQEKDFRKNFEKFQTYYDDTFFDQPGSYEVEIRDEDEELLVNKKFTID
ncbi:hypothetical protein LEP1GSC060_3173 [Leptospira weilii serovar Ranarum str. ICFT]|uniref:Uncharacterized protein n=1 Tax=Leptospira weilii serovar Ranarum str. ICFT TaxID=1218598 RepID=N1WIA4_9LEPT|nr:hypothetical protein [Leptospira weilii]EMY76859.1 hypothetical protein LEP1GSC060_3173 [Leptospira weilii serovar Ranarum str. ICFT]